LFRAILLSLLLVTNVFAATRDVSKYGAVGDGVVDDKAAFHAAAAAMRDGDTFLLTAGKKFRTTEGVVLRGLRDITVQGSDSPWVLDTSAYPKNTHLTITSAPEAEQTLHAWEEEIKAGWYVPPKTARPAYLLLGKDPFDSAEEHYGVILDRNAKAVLVPYDIVGRKHRIVALTTNVSERVTVRNFHSEVGRNQVVDGNVVFWRMRHARLQGLRGRVTGGVWFAEVEGGIAEDVEVDLVDHPDHTADNRAVSLWGSRSISIRGVKLRGDRSGGIMVENWCRDVVFDNVTANFSSDQDWFGDATPLFLWNGGSEGEIKRVKISSNSLVYPLDRGGQDTPLPRWALLEVGGGWLHLVEEWERQGWQAWKQRR
jgi:hypothetical protein